MRIAILGGGISGLTAAYYLSQKNHEIIVIEKSEKLGGLAGGFKLPHWKWDLERTYHHIFSNDEAILSLSKQIGFEGFNFSNTTTSTLFSYENNYRIFPVDSPKDFLSLPLLSLISKLRTGFTLVFLKLAPNLAWFEKITSMVFLQRTMGREAWRILWEQLFQKKYGKYAQQILASFIWARIKKRTKQLGYPIGGFQAFVDSLAQVSRKKGVKILAATTIQRVQKKGDTYEIEMIKNTGEKFMERADIILSTLPYPITCNVMKEVLGENYVREQRKRKYLFAINLILKTKSPILTGTYWLSIGVKEIPIMCIVQHTNFIDVKEYGGDEICYIGWYVDVGSDLLKMNEKEMLDYVLPHLRNISPHFKEVPKVIGLFKAPFAQPIFDAEFITIPRGFSTPAKNVFVANMDMTYPYDRGTNYAVQLGRDVSNYILKIFSSQSLTTSHLDQRAGPKDHHPLDDIAF